MKIVKTIVGFTDLKENIFRCIGDVFEVTEERAKQLIDYEKDGLKIPLVELIDEEEIKEEVKEKKGAKKNGK
ncbi:hypothetical protein HMPREF9630_00557 [Peptoanaerobacter stomatis]|uniref:Uncharacterized protein n=1 Tax=Peptoanaerobacter stomatis TaxID=796937 RepID=V9HKI7_9FIRM|nr:hypothetical protein [Peptoanaerobacter stomatis]EHL17390.1 hypothetical protein HMPREF9630_00557 [Peptoanaerobacter stomatis]